MNQPHPLASGTQQKYKFPIEQENQYKAFINFQPIITQPPSYGAWATENIGEMLVNGADMLVSAFTGVSTTSGMPYPDRTGAGRPTLTTTSEDYGLTTSSKKERSPESCKMYMPSSIQIQDGVNYSTADLGIAGATLQAGINNGEGIINSMINSAGQSITNVYDAMKGSMTQDAARLMTTRLAGMAGKNGVIDGAVRGSLRTSPIANITLLFDKPNLREFSFSFKMQPTTEKEAIMIGKIVKFFRTELYPEAFQHSQNGVDIPFGYRFPNEIQISFHYDDTKGPAANQYILLKPCYLKNFSTNYNANSATFYKGGYFQETSISMTFQENELLDKEDIRGGF